MKTLLLKLAGPLQSWGTGSNFETRHTDFYPSKSGVLGLVAGALGYRRDEDEKIRKLNELNFAVRVDQKGNLLRDYHIGQKYKNNGDFERTYVTNRYYLEDAIFLIALSHDEDEFIYEIEKALIKPYFQPYMGRRSLPLNSDFLIGVFNKGIIDLIKNTPWLASKWYKKRNLNELEAYLDSYLVEKYIRTKRKDRVSSFSQKERKFQYRYESMLRILVEDPDQKKDKGHDIFSYIGGQDVFIKG